MDKEKGVGRVGLCCPFHHELYHLLLLTQTLPSILGGERSRLIQVPPPRFFGMQEMPHWDAYWNSRPPDSSCCNLTPSPVSGPELPTPAHLGNAANDEQETWVPFVSPSTLEADHGNFLNLGPQPEGIYNQTWSNH